MTQNPAHYATQYQERRVPLRQGKFQVQVVEGGKGPDLLFLHGAGGFTGWTPFLDRLAEDYHVYAPAHPGVAGSEGLEYLDDLWDLMLFYEELMQQLGLEHTHLVGHSYGGMLAAELAAHRPERVTRLVLVCPLGLWLDESPVPDFFVLTPSESAGLVWHDPDSALARAYRARPEDPQLRSEATLEQTRTLAAVGKFIWPIPDRGLTKRAHRITMPTLLVWGDSDGMVPPIYGTAFQELLPHARLEVINRCGHLPQVERTEEFLKAVNNFLKD
jgi:pimeloyl-ACP methyl ester carboxylesterase